jgi:hypothetical protein
LYAVGQYRGVNVASIHMISDILCEDKWKPHFHGDKLRDAELLGVDLAVNTFLNAEKA